MDEELTTHHDSVTGTFYILEPTTNQWVPVDRTVRDGAEHVWLRDRWTPTGRNAADLPAGLPDVGASVPPEPPGRTRSRLSIWWRGLSNRTRGFILMSLCAIGALGVAVWDSLDLDFSSDRASSTASTYDAQRAFERFTGRTDRYFENPTCSESTLQGFIDQMNLMVERSDRAGVPRAFNYNGVSRVLYAELDRCGIE